MKKFNKLLAITLAIVICLLSVFAIHFFAAGVLDGYVYDLDDHGRAILVGWDNSSDILCVPAYIGNFRVIEIGNSAFKNDDYIHTLDLSGATYCDAIGMYAFAGSSLEGSLVIPTIVTYIGTSAFERCNGLTEVSFSSFGETVPAQCFQYCDNLQTVVLTDYITTIERYAFYNCTKLENVTIPRSVTSINNTAFSGCPNLVIHCYSESYAHQYAVDNGIDYVLIDAPAPTEPTIPTEPITESTDSTEATVPTETEATETTVATEPPTTAPEGYILGDADNSGNVDIVDATFAQRYVTHSDIPEEMLSGMDVRADVDSNGDVEATDVTFIMRHLIRVPTPYPIGELITI